MLKLADDADAGAKAGAEADASVDAAGLSLDLEV